MCSNMKCSHFVAENGASLGSLCGTLTDRADHDLFGEVLSSVSALFATRAHDFWKGAAAGMQQQGG